MSSPAITTRESLTPPPGFMKANVFRGPGHFGLESKPIPSVGYGEAVIKVRLTTICGTDIHIVRANTKLIQVSQLAMRRWGLYTRLDPVSPATLLGSVYWWELLRLAASANSALADTHRSAVARQEAGDLAIRSTAFKPSMCWFPTRRRI